MIADLKYLQQMTGNDSAMMREMIELFLSQLAEMRETIVKLAEERNWFELSRMAHKIKSSALVMGVMPMVDDMKELEMLAKDGKNTEKYPAYIARFHSMIESVDAELKTFLESAN